MSAHGSAQRHLRRAAAGERLIRAGLYRMVD
jgi:hypothetical protein